MLFAGIKTIPQGYNYTVERFGRFTRTLQPGLSLIVPFIDRIGDKMNMMEQVLDVPTQEVITKDNATVSADGIAFYQVLDAARAAYEVRGLENAILQLTMTNLRTVMGGMDLDELLSKRDDINDRLLHVVDSAASAWGIKVTRIEIKAIDPPRDIVESMGRQMKAEREKRAVILDAEGLRQSEILKAEGEKQALILQAEGRREAAFRDAEARERSAEAEAKATEMVSKAIAEGDVQAINYFVAQRYTQAIEKLASAPNQKVLMLPLEAAALIGSLAGIAEIAKETFSAEAQARRSGGRVPTDGRRHVMILQVIHQLGPWSWWILGLILLALEIVVPGNVFVWFGVAALITGVVALFTAFRLAGRSSSSSWCWRWCWSSPGGAFRAARRSRASSPSSTTAPTAWSAAPTCCRRRSSTATARSASTTPTGGSPAPTCRRARGSRWSMPTAPCSRWRKPARRLPPARHGPICRSLRGLSPLSPHCYGLCRTTTGANCGHRGTIVGAYLPQPFECQ